MVPFKTPASFFETRFSPAAEQVYHHLLSELGRQDFLSQTQTLVAYLSENHVSAAEALAGFQQFIWESSKRTGLPEQRYGHVTSMIRKIDHARRMLEDKVREEAVLEDLFLQLAQAG
jgi:hypothetical protein